MNVCLGFVILVAAIICFVLAATSSRMLGGESTIREGRCETIQNIDRGIHVVVNVGSGILVVGATYIFQVLSSPTRTEVDAAHDKLQWFDIGIPSLRNLLKIGKGRALLAVVILTEAVGSQVM